MREKVSVGLERFDLAPDDLADAVEENLADGGERLIVDRVGGRAVPRWTRRRMKM